MQPAWEIIRRAAREGFTPPADITVSEWADAYRILSGKGASEPGPYRSDRTPYIREPIDLLSESSSVEQVVLMWGSQVGKSEGGNNWLGYVIDIAPGPIMAVQPTIDLAKRYSRQRIAPMIIETPRLRGLVAENRSRNAAATTLLKDFPGGTLLLAGANSAAGLRSMPARYLFLDEIDAYPLDVDGEGDPVGLAERRTATFGGRKILKTSTPTNKGFSRIEQAFTEGDQRSYWVPCPHCEQHQVFSWPQVKWLRDDVGAPIYGSVRYACVHCGSVIEEHHKPWMLSHGEWRAANPGARVASFHLSALYSPLGWYSWETAVTEFYQANEAAKAGDVSKLRGWTNTVLAETWEAQGDRVTEHELKARADRTLQRRRVPRDALVLTCGVDVQGDRLEARVWAWGPNDQAWLIEREILAGSPADTAVWQRLIDDVLAVRWGHEAGYQIEISKTAIDTGGHHTQQVYNFCRAQAWRGVIAVKGASKAGGPIIATRATDQDVNVAGVKIRHGVKLWQVGTDTAKQLLYGRLRIDRPGPGYIHLPAWMPDDEYEQLTAERLVTKITKGRSKLVWEKPGGRRNEALDCAVYALAAAYSRGLYKWRAPEWERERAKLSQSSLLDPAPLPVVPALIDEADGASVPPPSPFEQRYTPPRPRGRRGSLASSYR